MAENSVHGRAVPLQGFLYREQGTAKRMPSDEIASPLQPPHKEDKETGGLWVEQTTK